jgi:PAS domain S-box-containing protein
MNTENQIISGIFHNSMDAILVTSPDGKILKANEAAVNLFGYTEEEIIQLGRSGLVDLSDPRLPVLLEARRQNGQARGELNFIRKDGSRFEGEVTSSVFKDNKGDGRTTMIIRDITPRKVAEDKLRESEERFRSLFRDNLSVMLLIDAETGDITDANDSALKYYGWTFKEITSRRIHDINLLGEAISDELKKAREKSQVHFEFRHRLADGSVRDIEAFASRIVIQGRDYMHSIILDITERKKNEQLMALQLDELRRKQEALKESEHKYRLLAENAGDVIFTMDRDFRFTYVSPAVTPLLGYTPEEVLMLKVSDILTPESLKIARKAVADIKTDVPFNEAVAENTFEMEMIRKDLTVVWTELKGSLIIDEGRGVSGILCVIRDISERKRTMDEMLKLSRAMEQNPTSIVITDKEGNIDYVNPKFTELTGYTLDEAKGQNPRILKSGYTTDEEYRQLWETISGGHEWKGEFRNKRKDGSLYWEQATISPVWNTSGEISYYLAIKEDITEKKRIMQELLTAKERAEESDRLKTAFLHNISHEIRTPLNAIVGFSSLLNIPDLADDKKREFANIINSSNEQLLSIITGIINLATLEAGQDKISEKQVNLNELLANVNRQFNVKRLPSGVTLSFHPSLPDGSSASLPTLLSLPKYLSTWLEML